MMTHAARGSRRLPHPSTGAKSQLGHRAAKVPYMALDGVLGLEVCPISDFDLGGSFMSASLPDAKFQVAAAISLFSQTQISPLINLDAYY